MIGTRKRPFRSCSKLEAVVAFRPMPVIAFVRADSRNRQGAGLGADARRRESAHRVVTCVVDETHHRAAFERVLAFNPCQIVAILIGLEIRLLVPPVLVAAGASGLVVLRSGPDSRKRRSRREAVSVRRRRSVRPADRIREHERARTKHAEANLVQEIRLEMLVKATLYSVVSVGARPTGEVG